jgi:hypothetical protein
MGENTVEGPVTSNLMITLSVLDPHIGFYRKDTDASSPRERQLKREVNL